MATPPTRSDHRIILHFDYDCFYASVFEAEQPALKSLPLAIQQKQIVVTCNYVARSRGLRKLQLISEAKRICPDVVIVLGEDLTKFRDASKDLYFYLRSFIWGKRIERLGFDELSLDVSDMIEYNVGLLNLNDLKNSFFYLDRESPTAGFTFDATKFYGHTYPQNDGKDRTAAGLQLGAEYLYIRLLVASHLAGHLRQQLDHSKGYTATVGISTCKVLAKLVGGVHKPNNQTALLPPYDWGEQDSQSNVVKFLDPLEIRAIPGIGSKTARSLCAYLTKYRSPLNPSSCDYVNEKITVHDVRNFPGMGPPLLEEILSQHGTSKGIGARIWNLIHGVDNSEVLRARDFPTQISIEDSYRQLDTFEGVRRELTSLSTSLIRRMRTDLVEKGYNDGRGSRWLAHPRTFRLSTRPRMPPATAGTRTYNNSRVSRSVPLPRYAFSLEESIGSIGEKLAHEVAISLFRKLHPARSGWDLRLLSVAVTNITEVADEKKWSNLRDIKQMFQEQQIKSPKNGIQPAPVRSESDLVAYNNQSIWEESDDGEAIPSIICGKCDMEIPYFARMAHEVYHSIGNGETKKHRLLGSRHNTA